MPGSLECQAETGAGMNGSSQPGENALEASFNHMYLQDTGSPN